MPKLKGVVPPIATPVKDGDRVDVQSLRKLTRYLVDAGVDGILANGTMGGFACLTDDEQLRSIATVVSEVNGAIPVMGGLGETNTSRALRKAKQIARENVTHLSILPPFYYFATQENLIAYYSEIASAVDVPIFLYDNPVMTKNHIQPQTVGYLRRKIPNIVGIKESNEDCANLQALLWLTRNDPEFSVLTGSEFLILVGLQMGCDGLIGGSQNLCPHLAVALYRAFRNGDLERARELQQELIEAWQIFRIGNIWGAFDEALRYLGLAERAIGAPYVSRLSTEEVAEVHRILDHHVKPHWSSVPKP